MFATRTASTALSPTHLVHRLDQGLGRAQILPRDTLTNALLLPLERMAEDVQAGRPIRVELARGFLIALGGTRTLLQAQLEALVELEELAELLPLGGEPEGDPTGEAR